LAASTVYDQPSAFPNGGMSSSEFDTSGGFGDLSTCYEDFALSQTTSITGATWQGGFYYSAGPATPDTISKFTIGFWADAAGQPGANLFSADILGDANSASLGSDASGFSVFGYSTALSMPFNAIAGTKYWFSVQAFHYIFPQWGWYGSNSGDGSYTQDFYGTRYFQDGDLAFSLLGTAGDRVVPEPVTILSAFMAVGGVGAYLRNRLQARKAA
jgi:hypothetical protein